jgi:hypothetical protein
VIQACLQRLLVEGVQHAPSLHPPVEKGAED